VCRVEGHGDLLRLADDGQVIVEGHDRNLTFGTCLF